MERIPLYRIYIMYILILARVVWNPSTKSTKRHSKGAWKHKPMGYKNQVGRWFETFFIFTPYLRGNHPIWFWQAYICSNGWHPKPPTSSMWHRFDLTLLMCRVGGVGVTCEVEDHFHGIQNRRRLDLGDRTTDAEVLSWKILRVSFGNWFHLWRETHKLDLKPS